MNKKEAKSKLIEITGKSRKLRKYDENNDWYTDILPYEDEKLLSNGDYINASEVLFKPN